MKMPYYPPQLGVELVETEQGIAISGFELTINGFSDETSWDEE